MNARLTEQGQGMKEIQDKLLKLQELVNEMLDAWDELALPTPIERIREDHAKVCKGIVQTGNTVKFCSCISDQSRQAIFAMHSSWHQDMAQRLIKLNNESDFLDIGDVLFLLGENAKWS
jgi:hypothetical protein